MCYHDSKVYTIDEVEGYYKVVGDEDNRDKWVPLYHENGYDYGMSPIVTKEGLGMFRWGLIPPSVKTMEDWLTTRFKMNTLNARSEDIYETKSYKTSAQEGYRCLIPLTGFYEWHWVDAAGKEKHPYYIHLKDQRIFSVAGIYFPWQDKANDKLVWTYSVLTCDANPLMAEIHNNKKRMPVIIPREYERDWLNPDLTKDDVLALCLPFDENKMDSYTVSKRITSKKDPTNVAQVMEKFSYEKTTLF